MRHAYDSGWAATLHAGMLGIGGNPPALKSSNPMAFLVIRTDPATCQYEATRVVWQCGGVLHRAHGVPTGMRIVRACVADLTQAKRRSARHSSSSCTSQVQAVAFSLPSLGCINSSHLQIGRIASKLWCHRAYTVRGLGAHGIGYDFLSPRRTRRSASGLE